VCVVMRELLPAGVMAQVVGPNAPRVFQSPIDILAVGRSRHRVPVSRIAVTRNWNGPINGYRVTRPRPTPTPSRVTIGREIGCRMAEFRAVRIAAVEIRVGVIWPVPIPG
jgi:hypothetical protein